VWARVYISFSNLHTTPAALENQEVFERCIELLLELHQIKANGFA
jgi:hypothetical protein